MPKRDAALSVLYEVALQRIVEMTTAKGPAPTWAGLAPDVNRVARDALNGDFEEVVHVDVRPHLG